MQIRHVAISWFRGIRQLNWSVGSNFVCLIGPGDSTKSTILEAMELTLSPRWNVQFDDSDFHQADTSQPILITVTVGQLPERLMSEFKFGLHLRGWHQVKGLQDEPDNDCEPVLSVQLRVDSSLQPEWVVVNNRNQEGYPISARDREYLGVARIGAYLDRELTWSRSSVLTRLTGDSDELPGILANASRAARQALSPGSLAPLEAVAKQAEELGAQLGITTRDGYQPRFDAGMLSVNAGSLSLHDGEVPVRHVGLGSRRLLALGLQRRLSATGGISIIDEVEQGLEPHRIRRLLNVLREPRRAGDSNGSDNGQVIMTTHSPIVAQELEPHEIQSVRSNKGVTEVCCLPPDMRRVVRGSPEAVFGRKLLVCEGKTEIGVCRAFDQKWSLTAYSFAYVGAVLVDGGGTSAPELALAFRRLGYEVAFLGDSDVKLDPSEEQMSAAGIKVVLWADDMSIEQRIAADLPWQGITEAVSLAMREKGGQSVVSAVSARLSLKPAELPDDPALWSEGRSAVQVRKAIGDAAKKGEWFKRVDLGEQLGQIVTEYVESISQTDLSRKIAILRGWVYDD